MTVKNITLNRIGKRFLATILAIAMIISAITVQSANNIAGAEETATDEYVIENTSSKKIDVVIRHMLNGRAIYSADEKEIPAYSKVNNYKKAVNYNVSSVVVGNDTLRYSSQWSNIELSNDTTIVVNYQASSATVDRSVSFYDYLVRASGANETNINNLKKSINWSGNYKNGQLNDNFTVGHFNESSGKYYSVDPKTGLYYNVEDHQVYAKQRSLAATTMEGYDQLYNSNGEETPVYINSWRSNPYYEEVKYGGSKYYEVVMNGSTAIRRNIIKGLDNQNNVVFNYDDPGVFTDASISKNGKQNIDNYKLRFNRTGDTYQLRNVLNENNRAVLSNYTGTNSTNSSNFWPLDGIKNSGISKDEKAGTSAHNSFFGMRYDIEFNIGDYLGDLNYSFSGDDDLWVLLDGKVVIDLGGIHAKVDGNVDIWDALNLDKNNLTDEQKEQNHRLTILYMERGSNESNCYMNFTIPNARFIDVSDAPKADLTISKVSSEDSNTKLPGARFTLVNDSNSSDISTLISDSSGNLKLSNLVAGTYTLTEVSAPDGYQISESTYKVVVTNNYDGTTATARLYKADGKTPISSNTITNDPIKITTDNLKTDKTAKLLDWDKRTYQIDLYAAHDIKATLQPLNLALMLDFSGSMPWFVAEPTGGTTTLNKLNRSWDDRYTETLNKGGSKGTGTEAWDYKYYVKRKGEGTAEEYKPIAYAGDNTWRFVKSKSDGNKVFEENGEGKVDSDETVYIRGENDQTKLEALQIAVTNFIENLKVVSPDSQVAIIPFAGVIINDADYTNNFTSVQNINIKEIFADITLLGGTKQELALDKATDLLGNRYDKENTYGILFSDGDANSNPQTVANAADRLKNKVKLLFTAGIFGDTNSSGARNMESWASEDPVEGTKKLVYIRDTANDLIDAFSEIFGYITTQIKNVTITDYIDNRFIITDEQGNELKVGDNFAGGVIGQDSNGTYIQWTNVTLSYAEYLQYGWHRIIYVRANDDYIGGNNVKTNIDEISNVKLEDGSSKPFETPVVNVKAELKIGNQQEVIFKGDTLNASNINLPLQYVYGVDDEGNPLLKDVADRNGITTAWYSDTALSQNAALDSIKTDSSYYQKATYNAGVATDKSNENSTINGKIYQNSETVDATNIDDSNKNYGILDIKVVAGRLAITKEINAQYTSKDTARKTNATQTFVFKIDQYTDDTKSQKVRTFYETITFNANDDDTKKTKYISELEKGYYVVTEETAWSSKYSIDDSTKKVQEFNIGDLESTDGNGKKTFSGLDDNANCNYTKLANGKAAGFSFKNILKPWIKWYSDTGSAKNRFEN